MVHVGETTLLTDFLLFSPDEQGVKVLMVLMFRYSSTDSVERVKKKIERTLYQNMKIKQLPLTISKPSFNLTRKSFPNLFIEISHIFYKYI